ncbi:MAG: serine/threonine-protein kinase [Patescibacteria group bacterium]|nr:MAG: serine/threonine-protein kinase [Patescibacteria group bacterium]
MLNERYRILRRLHESVMSTVYVAQDMRNGRYVVVKSPRAIGTFHDPAWETLDIPELAERTKTSALNEYILREALVLSGLSHPHIVRLQDAGTDGWGNRYVVLEFLEGLPLHLLRRRKINRLKARTVINLGRQLLEGLEAVHAAGFVHRDIKPANLIMTSDSLKIVDFALACSIHVDDPRAAEGYMVGTPLYASPEQCNGQKRVDGRADLYAVGHVLYRLLSETWAYGREKSSIRSIIDRQKYAEPIPFDIAAPGMRVSESLESVIFRALEKRPEDRFQSAGEMREALLSAQA